MTNSPMLAINDMIAGAKRWPLWLNLAWEEISTTYRRSTIGVAWVTLSFLLFIGVKVFVFVPILGGFDDATYYSLYLALGFTVWQFISNVILGSANVFITAANWLKNDSLPVSVFAFQLTSRAMFNFGLTLVAMIAILAFIQLPVSWISLVCVLSIPIYILTSFSLAIVLGFICTRFRDIKHIIELSVRILLFLSPIFWTPAMMGEVFGKYLKWNPIVYYIDIFRSPIIDQAVNLESWIIVGTITGGLFLLSVLILFFFKRRLIFWI